jgi:protein LSM14
MNYIGKKINVTTNSGYQYEGILAKVNTADSTIELQMVRRLSHNSTPINDSNIYEFIVFKSDDIADLYVYQDIPELGPDPAIVSAKTQSAANSKHNGGNDHGDWLDPQFPSSRAPQKPSSVSPSSGINFGVPSQPQPIAFGSVGYSSAVGMSTKSTNSAATNASGYNQAQEKTAPVAPPSSFAAAAASSATVAPTFTPIKQQQQDTAPTVRSYSTASKQTTRIPASTSSQQNADQQQNYQQQQHQRQYKPRQQPYIPNSEYDFEQANQRFDKEQVAAEVATTIVSDVPFYQKSSFFDNISSESANISEERNRTERSWNIETFGQPYVRSNNPSAGRGGRGRGGRPRGGSHIHRNATGSFQ